MKNKSLFTWIGIVVVGGGLSVCAGCFLLGGLAAITGGSSTAATQGEARPTRERAGEVAPVEDVQVSPTPLPTNTPEPQMPPEVKEYLRQASVTFEPLPEALGTIGELLEIPRVNDVSWQVDVDLEIAKIQRIHKELSELQPPSDIIDVHNQMIDATTFCSKAVTTLDEALEEESVHKVELSSIQLQTCNTAMGTASTMMQTYVGQFN